VVDVNTSHTPEDGAHSPSWPNGLTIIINIYRYFEYVTLKRASTAQVGQTGLLSSSLKVTF